MNKTFVYWLLYFSLLTGSIKSWIFAYQQGWIPEWLTIGLFIASIFVNKSLLDEVKGME